jgi:hypothetical protein
MQEVVNRRESLKLVGAAALGAAALVAGPKSASAAEPTLPKIPRSKDWEEKLRDLKVWQGKVYTVGTAVEQGFSFSIMDTPTSARSFGIDPSGKHADSAIRVVLQAYEKGALLIVWEDAAKPGYVGTVVAL